MTVAPISECNHCRSNEGFYTKDYVVGKTQYNHNFNGSEAENGEYWGNTSVVVTKCKHMG
ncbi:hypothetical protein BK120_33700 [Paenibacillus sp. FSL A5-0031]|nr:hypothetical protein BK120_33700 [Paenibacillus sp. FSL A5-0031]